MTWLINKVLGEFHLYEYIFVNYLSAECYKAQEKFKICNSFLSFVGECRRILITKYLSQISRFLTPEFNAAISNSYQITKKGHLKFCVTTKHEDLLMKNASKCALYPCAERRLNNAKPSHPHPDGKQG